MVCKCETPKSEARRPNIKCIVWDLDETLWHGTLLEGDEPTLRPNAKAVLEELDNRGILHAVVSKNDRQLALERLTRLDVMDYFVCSRIGWSNKSESVRQLAEDLGLRIESFLFVDDQAFERDEVHDAFPEVETLAASELNDLLAHPRMQLGYVTSETSQRRKMYQADIARKESEAEFVGTRDAFLQTLGMRVTIRKAVEEDLMRAEELITRTNQLNTTGRPYSRVELQALLSSDNHRLLVVDLQDRYGSSGIIGLALIGRCEAGWLIKLLIMSCRVISRGIGSLVLTYILHAARESKVRLQAEFVDSGRNRMMYIAYKFSGFVQTCSSNEVQLLEHDLQVITPFPPHVTLIVSGL